MTSANALTRWSNPTIAVVSTLLALYVGYKVVAKRQKRIEPLPTSPLLLDHFQFVNVNGKHLRTVHIPHELGPTVPLLVFIHGVGGQLEQFERQIEYFSLSTHILAIDLCGYGASDVPDSFEDYTSDAYAEDIATLIRRYKSDETVLICHSYGCTIGTHLYHKLTSTEETASSSSEPTEPTETISVKAVVMICPKAVVSEHDTKMREQLLKTPNWAIELARKLDRMGGAHSKSVNRLLHSSASEELRLKQLQWNTASRTTVLKRVTAGLRWPTKQEFQGIQSPLLLMTGEDDHVCPSPNVELLYKWCSETNPRVGTPFIIPRAGHIAMLENWELVTPIISSFLVKDCGLTTMDPAWQITKKAQLESKWSLKNTEKWLRTPCISTAIGKGNRKFRAMKVLRQTDPDHSPLIFLAKYPEIGLIVDISLDEPPYMTTDFEDTRITYTKLPTVSKIPPSREDVDRFIRHCNACWTAKPGFEIAVHCHYGFNRTGFMICSYLIEELQYTVADALHQFEVARPPRGIRHDHFKGELYLRYEPPIQLKSSAEAVSKVETRIN
ncbi:hypothetical protein BGW38_009654 [Lunasporangiospora selenospora]|uniref:Tyrosine specific protein phosphatases domain-containing protein n=1 Tax=Lunasporangiospora selenospora TaxID=979761 RepID=A0A9P6FZ68_9FUNG|nr:hypothetical protein BGW38_009654 [Lunasporangiospora selenospora]